MAARFTAYAVAFIVGVTVSSPAHCRGASAKTMDRWI
jgi:hypothetical protein